MKGMCRREFVRLSATAAGGVVCGGCLGSSVEPSGEPGPFESDEPADPTAWVSAARGSNLYEMTRDAVDAIWGIHSVVG